MQEYECQVLLRPDSDELRFLPEGPYTAEEQVLSWVAIQHGAEATTGSLNLLDLRTGKNSSFPLPGRPGFAFPANQPGVFVLGLERRVQLFDLQAGVFTALGEEVDRQVEGTIINDAVVFEGGLIFGCKDLRFEEAKAGLYLWRNSDQTLIRLREDQICSNGKVVQSRDGELVLLDIDTPTKTVVEYPLDAPGGRLGASRIVLDLRQADDYPDGMIATPDGKSVIIAFYNPHDAPQGEARQYNLGTGQLEAVWRTPQSPQVTCPQLIHYDGRVRLVLTTAVEHMSPERQARHVNAGCLFLGETSFSDVSPQPAFEI